MSSKTKLIDLLLNVGKEVSGVKASHKHRLTYAILEYLFPVFIFLLAKGIIGSFAKVEETAVWLIIAIFLILIAAAFAISSLESIIVNIAILASSIKAIKNNDKKGLNIACLILSIIYFFYFALSILFLLSTLSA